VFDMTIPINSWPRDVDGRHRFVGADAVQCSGETHDQHQDCQHQESIAALRIKHSARSGLRSK